MTPIFTDLFRYPFPYIPANMTNIAETFRRERKRRFEKAVTDNLDAWIKARKIK